MRKALLQPIRPKQCCTLDFMGHGFADGRSDRTLNVFDGCARYALAIKIDLSFTVRHVVRALGRLCDEWMRATGIDSQRQRPRTAEQRIEELGVRRVIGWGFTQPGHAEQNAYINRFHGMCRSEVQDAYQFETLVEARRISEAWRKIHNDQRARGAIGHPPPRAFNQRWQQRQSLLMAGSV